jgi:ABC-type multidrug transport system ATPase subunit
VLEYFSGLHNITYGAARAQLAKVLFMNEDVNKKIKYLSGGERSRLRLCSLTFTGVNVLILDEPTNHLDIDSREVLEDTLLEFDGTLLFVSHDRYFINKISDKIIAIEAGSTKVYNGDYHYYQDERQKIQDGNKNEISNDNSAPENNKNANQRVNNNENHRRMNVENTAVKVNKPSRKIEFIEKNIEDIEARIKALEELMNQYVYDSNHLREIYEDKEKAEKELEQAYSEWEALQYN